MELDDFLKDFPDKWKIYYNAPQLERELGKVSTEKLIKRLEVWCERFEKGRAEPRDSDLEKVGFVNGSKDELPSKLEQENGETKAKKCLMELKGWFKRLEDKLDEPLDSKLMNDLFFGFLTMFKFRNQGMQFKESIAINEDSRKEVKYYEQLQKLSKNVPKADVKLWRREWQGRFQNLLEEWNQATGIKQVHKVRARMSDKVKRYCKAFAGRSGQEIPKINKDISAYLKNCLAERLKNKHDRRKEDEERFANDCRAAPLIVEGANILNIKLEDWNRLRTA